MSHPILVAALAEDRAPAVPLRGDCSAALRPVPQCRAAAIWRRETEQTRPPVRSRLNTRLSPKARLFARVTSLLQIISKGAES